MLSATNRSKGLLGVMLLTFFLMTGCSTAPAAPTSASKPEPVSELPAIDEPVPEQTSQEETVIEPTETAPFEVTIRPVITGEQKQVTVTTVDEFLAAIGPDTEIILNGDLLDLSKARGYGETNTDYYRWSESYDGPELIITRVSNLTIRGSGEDHNTNVISAAPRYANVLTFENCSNVHVAGFTAGHAEEPGYCLGGVLCFQNSENVLVEDCGLFGCGTLGVTGYNSKDIQIVNNDIYDCSVGGVELNNCDNVNVDGNTFRDLGGPVFRVYGCGVVTCNGEDVWDYIPR